jgi:hypothetical protein
VELRKVWRAGGRHGGSMVAARAARRGKKDVASAPTQAEAALPCISSAGDVRIYAAVTALFRHVRVRHPVDPNCVHLVRSFRHARLWRRLMSRSLPASWRQGTIREVAVTGPGGSAPGPVPSRGVVRRRDLTLPVLGREYRGRRLEPLEGEPQAQERLPDDLGDGRDALHRSELRDDPEQHSDP